MKHDSNISLILKKKYGIHRIAITSRMLGLEVNSYFIEEPYPTLIDVPPDKENYLDELNSGLNKVGFSLDDMRRIIVTHPHLDHFGSASHIAEISGAEIMISRNGAEWFEGFEDQIEDNHRFRQTFLFKAGANYVEVEKVKDFYQKADYLARNIKHATYLKDGDSIEISSFTFKITSVPGHTPWCILLHDIENRLGFSGDFLQSVTTNPLIQRNHPAQTSYNSIVSYIDSLKKVNAMCLKIVLPGHGWISEDGSKKARDILRLISKRREMILRILKNSCLTPVDISYRLFPGIIPEKLFNAVCEIMVHLDLLTQEGEVAKVGNDPLCYTLF